MKGKVGRFSKTSGNNTYCCSDEGIGLPTQGRGRGCKKRGMARQGQQLDKTKPRTPLMIHLKLHFPCARLVSRTRFEGLYQPGLSTTSRELWVSVQADATAPAPNEEVLDVAMPTSLTAQNGKRKKGGGAQMVRCGCAT